jgi:hypothetical protein
MIPQEITIPLKCEGNCTEKMEIKSVDWGNETDFYVTFSIDTFYVGQSIFGVIKERIKLAWLAIRKGNYIHNEILTSAKALSELNGKLSEMLTFIDSKGTKQ